MKDIYRKNKHSGQPMAVKSIDTIEFTETFNYLWIDRMITSLYIVFISFIDHHFFCINAGNFNLIRIT